VKSGREREVELIAQYDVSFPLASDEAYNIALDAPDVVKAPIVGGDVAGIARIYVAGVQVAEVELIYAKDVPKSSLASAFEKVFEMWVAR
jgi:D-alanyl-D-alanine carboxypeptidase